MKLFSVNYRRLRRLIIHVLRTLILLPLVFYPARPKEIVFYSDPDVSDNSLFLFTYLRRVLDSDWKFLWVVKDIEYSRLYLKSAGFLDDRVIFLSKSSRLPVFFRTRLCAWQFDTHGAPTEKIPFRNRVAVSLWHGSPLKRIGNDITPGSFSGGHDYVVSAHSFFNNAFSSGLGVDLTKLIVTGYPRNDVLVRSVVKLPRYIVWMPTYGKSDGESRGGGYSGVDSLVPDNSLGFVGFDDLKRLDEVLSRTGVRLVVKLHPYDVRNGFVELYENFRMIDVIKANDPRVAGEGLYVLLAGASGLVSDCSSVIFDFMLTGRPIAIDMESLKLYKRPFAFAFDPAVEGLDLIDSIDLFEKFTLDVSVGGMGKYDASKFNEFLCDGACSRVKDFVGMR